MKKHLSIVFPILALSVILSGCASKKNWIEYDRTNQIHKVAVLTRLMDEDIKIMDRTTDVWTEEKDNHAKNFTVFGGLAGAAIWGLTEGATLHAKAQQKIRTSLGGDPTELAKAARNLPVKDSIDKFLQETLKNKYEVVLLDQNQNDHSFQNANSISEFLSISKQLAADTFILLEYNYGVAGYSDQKSSVSIVGKLLVYNVADGEKMLKRNLYSDMYFNKGRTVHEFAADDCKLFKEDLNNASKALAILVGNEFSISSGVNNFN